MKRWMPLAAVAVLLAAAMLAAAFANPPIEQRPDRRAVVRAGAGAVRRTPSATPKSRSTISRASRS